MTAPAVTFADPEALAVATLTNWFDDHQVNAPTVSVAFPTNALGDGVSHLQVNLESSDVTDYPVTERATVRVTAYAGPGRRTAVKVLASVAQAVLVQLRSGDVAGTVPMVGRSDVTTDPDTKNLLCWFTIRLDLTPTPLAQ